MSEHCPGVSCCDPLFTETNPTPPPAVISVPPPPAPPPPIGNTEQTATANCPSGTTGNPQTATVAADTYFARVVNGDTATAQANANSQAYSAALAAATAKLSCGIAGQLSGLLWELSCVTHSAGSYAACGCRDQLTSLTLEGNAGQLYVITVRIRGVIEMKQYATPGPPVSLVSLTQPNAGDIQPVTTDYFAAHSLGTAVPPSAASLVITNGSDGDLQFNFYELDVSSPAQVFLLNNIAYSDFIPAAAYQQQVWPVDFQFSFTAYGGAVVTLATKNMDGFEVENGIYDAFNHRLGGGLQVADTSGLKPSVGTTAFDGQYLQLDEISIS